MTIAIEKLDGSRYDLKSFGLIPLVFTVESPAPRHSNEVVEGRDGHLDLGTTFEGRTMRCTFLMRATDHHDYLLLRDEVFRLFDARTFFYIIDKYEPRKRWLVKTAAMFTPERVNLRDGSIEIPFQSPSPYAESYGTTLDPFTFTAEKWQVGQGVIAEDLVYAHNITEFQIYNGSDIPINPREIPLKIKYQGASQNLMITNKTTGDEWKFNGNTGANDTLLLDGVRSLKNGLTVFGQTNRKLLSLAPGYNSFKVTGTVGSFLLSFDFRFYTL